MYLFDSHEDDDGDIAADQDEIRAELLAAGFRDLEVTKAFQWIEALAGQQAETGAMAATGRQSMRLFTPAELERLDTHSRGYLLSLERSGVINAGDRELIIDRVMALEADDFTFAQLKWVILMVLLNQPGGESRLPWMEDVVLDDRGIATH
jgi:Smg protein